MHAMIVEATQRWRNLHLLCFGADISETDQMIIFFLPLLVTQDTIVSCSFKTLGVSTGRHTYELGLAKRLMLTSD